MSDTFKELEERYCAEIARLKADQQTYADTYARNMERMRAEVEHLRDERQAVIHCINLYGDEVLHSALDAIGFALGTREAA